MLFQDRGTPTDEKRTGIPVGMKLHRLQLFRKITFPGFLKRYLTLDFWISGQCHMRLPVLSARSGWKWKPKKQRDSCGSLSAILYTGSSLVIYRNWHLLLRWWRRAFILRECEMPPVLKHYFRYAICAQSKSVTQIEGNRIPGATSWQYHSKYPLTR